MSLPTVADLRAHANMTRTVDDAELQDHLDAAVEVVEGLVGPLSPQAVTETHRHVSSGSLLLRRSPVASLSAVSSRSGASVTALAVGDFEVDEAGVLRRADGSWLSGTYVVTYAAGREVLPASVYLATLIIAAHLWETQRMPGLAMDSAPAGFGGADGIPDTGSTGRGFAIPRRAEELLQSHMRPTIA